MIYSAQANPTEDQDELLSFTEASFSLQGMEEGRGGEVEEIYREETGERVMRERISMFSV